MSRRSNAFRNSGDERRLRRAAARGDQAAAERLRERAADGTSTAAELRSLAQRAWALPWNAEPGAQGGPENVGRDLVVERIGRILRENRVEYLLETKTMSAPVVVRGRASRRHQRVTAVYGFTRDEFTPDAGRFILKVDIGSTRTGQADPLLAVAAFKNIAPLIRWRGTARGHRVPENYWEALDAYRNWLENAAPPRRASESWETAFRRQSLIGTFGRDDWPCWDRPDREVSEIEEWMRERLPRIGDLFLGEMGLLGLTDFPARKAEPEAPPKPRIEYRPPTLDELHPSTCIVAGCESDARACECCGEPLCEEHMHEDED